MAEAIIAENRSDRIPLFYGNKESDQIDAENYIAKINTGKATQGWSDAKTIKFFKGALRGSAAQWSSKVLERHPEKQPTWEWFQRTFLDSFVPKFQSTSTTKEIIDLKMRSQENPREFFTRCMTLQDKIRTQTDNFNLGINIPPMQLSHKKYMTISSQQSKLKQWTKYMIHGPPASS